MKKLILIGFIGFTVYACNNGGSSDTKQTTTVPDPSGEKIPTPGGDAPAYDPNRGVGKFTHVDISPTLNATLADAGNKVYSVKCSACHKLTNEKLVGPGWSGVTQKLSPEWIMNFITNPDAMIDKDPEAQAQLEICLVRMPNQNLTDEDARNIYEFMRMNDGVK